MFNKCAQLADINLNKNDLAIILIVNAIAIIKIVSELCLNNVILL